MMPEAFLSVSCEILPAIRFYDRVSTTALNAYIGPMLDLYLGPKLGLLNKLAKYDFQGILLIMASQRRRHQPRGLHAHPRPHAALRPRRRPGGRPRLRRGPGLRRRITCDMGGTSFDVALIKDGKPLTTTEGEINRLRISCPCSTSSPSARAAAPSAGSTRSACCAWARRARAPTRARPATTSAAPSPPAPTPTWCSATSTPTSSPAAA